MSNVTLLQPDERSDPVLSPLTILESAVKSGANIETLEKLMALQERFEAAQARREFAEAIARAKSEIKPIVKNRRVDFESKKTDSRTEYDFEDLAAVASAVDPILSKNGLSYRYRSKQEATIVSVTCIIAHRLGHFEETTLQAAADTSGNKNHVQAIGSTVTYLQRYTLKLALGLAATKDTDGIAPPTEGPKTIDDAQYRYLQDLMEKAGADEDKFKAFLGVTDLETLTQVQYRNAESALRKKINTPGKAK